MNAPERAPVGIELRGLSAVFRQPGRDDVPAVRAIDLDIRPGELLTLLGPSGCGKTTTLRMIAGFQEPSAGHILIGGADITALPANRRDIGLVFQSYALFPHLTVFENVAYGLRVRKVPPGRIRPEVDAALRLVGLSGLGERQIHELSGGQQQRVALARATVIRPRVLLFDEPLSNLDAKLRVQVRDEIAELQRRLGITTVYVTHDQEEAMAISDRIAVMETGTIAQLGRAEDLYREPASAFVATFLGRANLLDASVRDVRNGTATLSIADHAVEVLAQPGIVVGGRVRVLVRPEAVRIRAYDASEGLKGKIVGRTFLGEKTEYRVELGRDVLQVAHPNGPDGDDFQMDTSVSVILPRNALRTFPFES